MKQAVNNFIDEVNKKYWEEADHRISIVTFWIRRKYPAGMDVSGCCRKDEFRKQYR